MEIPCRSISFQLDLDLANRELQHDYLITNFEQLWIIILHKNLY